MAGFGKLPSGNTLSVQPFKVQIPEKQLQDLKQLLELSPLAGPTFENTNTGRRYGMNRDWLLGAKQAWSHDFDWRKVEERINTYPSFKASVKDKEGNDIELHFLALFSENPGAVPLAFYHGWPGSNLDFMDILDKLKEQYTPQTLPYHVVVPSLPGYGFSSGPPVDKDYGIDTAASALHELMIGLGFGKSGYLVQGGDLGSFMCRVLALSYEECKGMHVNMMVPSPPQTDKQPDELEKRAMDRGREFMDTAYGFAYQQGTRAATVGLILSSSPLALLTWVGEKMLEWTDDDPPMDKILETVTLWWLTGTAPRSFYHSRSVRVSHSTSSFHKNR
jgi:microsomal epoxide hydrolase